MSATNPVNTATVKTVDASERHMELCNIKARMATELTREETQDLMSWCDCQTEDLWDGMTLQEILNVYRVSAEFVTWEDWASDDRKAAHKAWNSAVIDAGNRMVQS